MTCGPYRKKDGFSEYEMQSRQLCTYRSASSLLIHISYDKKALTFDCTECAKLVAPFQRTSPHTQIIVSAELDVFWRPLAFIHFLADTCRAFWKKKKRELFRKNLPSQCTASIPTIPSIEQLSCSVYILDMTSDLKQF